MIIRTVLCNRCGKEVTEEHPDRISVSKQHYKEVINYKGDRKLVSKYKAESPIHFCTECNRLFKAFLDNKY